MKSCLALIAMAAGLMASVSTNVHAADSADSYLQEMEAAAERVRQSGEQFRADLKRMREERMRLQKKQEAENKLEEERARQQAAEDEAKLAAVKSAQERKALEMAQERSRKEARAKAEQAELARKEELTSLQVNELAAHQAIVSPKEMSREERIARAKAALAEAKAETSEEPRAFDDEAGKSEEALRKEKAARAQAVLEQMRLQSAPKAFE